MKTVQEHLLEVVGGHEPINISISIRTRFVALASEPTPYFFLNSTVCNFHSLHGGSGSKSVFLHQRSDLCFHCRH